MNTDYDQGFMDKMATLPPEVRSKLMVYIRKLLGIEDKPAAEATADTPSVSSGYDKAVAAPVKKAGAESTLGFSTGDPYDMGMHAKRTGEDYQAAAMPIGVPRYMGYGAIEGGLIGGALGHPLSNVIRKPRTVLANLIDDADLVRETYNKIRGNNPMMNLRAAWDLAKNSVTGQNKGVTKGTAVANVLADTANTAFKGTGKQLMPVLKRRLKGGLIAGLGGAAIMGGGKLLSNAIQYHEGQRLTPNPVKPKE